MSAILNVLAGDKKTISGQKRYSGTKNDTGTKNDIRVDISFLCPPIINLIKAKYVINTTYNLFTETQGNTCVLWTEDRPCSIVK